MSDICTVVVTYNRLDLLKKAIDAIRNQTHKSDILVVNNGSNDGTKEWLDGQPDLIKIHQENLGGAGGFHVGMKYAAEHHYKFCWVMDDDVEPLNDALESLVKFYNKHIEIEKIGFLCSNVVDKENRPANNPTISLKRNKEGHSEWNKYLKEGVVGISAATFVSVFIPTEIIMEVGLPYKEFFIWGDDTEYTNRISSKYPCFCVGKSVVKHFRTGGAIDLITLSDKKRIQMYKYSVRNNWFNNKRGYYEKKEMLINYLWHISIIARLLAKFQFRKVSVVFKGIFEGIVFNPKVEFPSK